MRQKPSRNKCSRYKKARNQSHLWGGEWVPPFQHFFFFFLVGLIEGCAPFEAFFGEWGTNVSKLAHNSQKWLKKKKKMSEMGLNC